MNTIATGFHALAVGLVLTTAQLPALEAAMTETVHHGGTMFEVAFGVCQIPWEEVAKTAQRAGIKEISLCHFWAKDKRTGKPVNGDPLGSKRQRTKAFATLKKIFAAAEILRNNGIIVRFIDGPLGWLLGHEYTNLSPEEQKTGLVRFLKHASKLAKTADLILAVEFLRPEEDKVVGGTEALVEILDAVNHPNAKGHLDVFHALEQGENPIDSAEQGRHIWVYVHGHAAARMAPGNATDDFNWPDFMNQVGLFSSVEGSVPFIFEPFSEKACEEEPALGDKVVAIKHGEMPKYLETAFSTIKRVAEESKVPIAA